MQRFSCRSLAGGLVLGGALLLGACGGGGDQRTTATLSALTDSDIRSALVAGLTRDALHSGDTLAAVYSGAPALRAAGQAASGLLTRKAAPGRALRSARAGGGTAGGDPDWLRAVRDVIEQSTVTRSGDTALIDPDEVRICQADWVSGDWQATCQAFLAHVTLQVRVDATEGSRITAATVTLRFDDSDLAQAAFTPTSSYDELSLDGLAVVLAWAQRTFGEPAEVPDTLRGAIRLAFTRSGDRQAALTLSVPRAIQVVQGGERFDFAATERLAALSADADALTLSGEVNLAALDLRSSDSDAGGRFPVRLLVQSLTGRLTLADSGRRLTVTGAGLDTLRFQVDGGDAVSAHLAPLDAELAAGGAQPSLRLDRPLDFDLRLRNLRGYLADLFDGSTDPGLEWHAAASAPAGTTFGLLGGPVVQISGTGSDVFHGELQSPGDTGSVDLADGDCFNLDSWMQVSCTPLQ